MIRHTKAPSGVTISVPKPICHTAMPTIRQRNGRHQAQVRIKENGVIVHQESATFDTHAQAIAWGVALEKRIAKTGVEARKQGMVSLADLMDMHVKMLKKIGREYEAIEHRFKNIRAYPFTEKPVESVTSADFIDWAIKHAPGRSPATLLNHLMAVRAAYRAAPVAHGIPLDMGVVANAIDHLRRMQLVAPSKRRDRRVSDAEIAQIEAWWRRLNGTSIPLPTILRFLVALPRRREEVMSAKWEDYNPKTHTLILRDTKHPTMPRDEVVPVPPAAQKILAGMPRTKGPIFPYRGKSVSSGFKRAAAFLELGDITLHDLRHEGISRLFEAGLTIPEVSMISGHTSWESLKRYTHIQPQHVLDKLVIGEK
jgi:integrase